MYDVIIAGAGIVGCAAAHELSKYKLRVLVLERENDVSMGTTRANTAILHAGYDPMPGTKMARYNVQGARMAQELCTALKVPMRRIPSLVVARDAEQDRHVQELYRRGIANGVEGLSVLTGAEARLREPALTQEVTSALLAETAAIVDPMRYCIALARCAAANGVSFSFLSPVTQVEEQSGRLMINNRYETKVFLNCAGLNGDQVARLTDDSYEIRPVAGAYCLLDKREGTRVSSVIFPCPSEKGKGIVVTPTVHGNLLAGPTADPWTDKEDVSVLPQQLEQVRREAAEYVENIDFSAGIRVFSGLRAYGSTDDFFVGPGQKRGVFHAIGIKSPGLTAAPAIARDLARMISEYLGNVEENTAYELRPFVSPFRDADEAQRDRLIQRRPSYGRIICRCEGITQGEMEDELSFPLPPVSVDGMKRRVGSGMGRCQGGFCMPRVHEILSAGTGIPMEEVLKDGRGSVILKGGRLK